MRKLLLLLSVCTTFGVYAQQPSSWCSTPNPSAKQRDEMINFLNAKDNPNARIDASIKNVAIKAHILRQSNGVGGFGLNILQAVIDTLNKQYIGANIQFYLSGNQPNYINDDNNVAFNPDNEYILCQRYDVNNAINIYFVRSFTNGIGGYSYFPATNKNTNRLFCAYANTDDLIKKIVPHEMGHYFGLWHTFQDSWTSNASEFVTRGTGANCSYAGDLLCDTPADPYGKVLVIGSLPCDFKYNESDANGDKYVPSLSNLMSYYRGCGNNFSKGQHQLMQYGILKRLTPHPSPDSVYNILGGVDLSKRILTGTPDVRLICAGQKITVPFSTVGDFKEGTVFKVILLSELSDFAAEIGKGTQKNIECTIPKEAPYYFSYRVQVLADDESVRGTLSANTFNVNQPPTATLSGEDNIFIGESFTLKVNYTGGSVSFKLNTESSSRSTSNIYSPLSITVFPSKTTIYKIDNVNNTCGSGTVNGEFKLTVSEKPIATAMTWVNAPSALCLGQSVRFYLQANGIFNVGNFFKIDILDDKGQVVVSPTITSMAYDNASITFPKDLSTDKKYSFRISASNPKIEYISPLVPITSVASVTIGGDRAIFNGQATEIEVNNSIRGTTYNFLLSDGRKFETDQSPFKILVSPDNSTEYTLLSATTSGCSVANISGKAKITVQKPLTTNTLKIRSVCGGQSIDVPFTVDNLKVNDLVVQLSDANGSNYATIPSSGQVSPLKATIPKEILGGGRYKVRIYSPSLKIAGSESNEFEIKTLPKATLAGYAIGNKTNAAELFIKLSGTLPIDMQLSDGTSQRLNTLANSIFVNPTKTQTYTISTLSNECGNGTADGKGNVEFRDNTTKYCTPIITNYTSNSNLSHIYIDDPATGYRILNNVQRVSPANGYTFFQDRTLLLQKNKDYRYTISSFASFSPYGSAFGTETPLRAWIDFNQDNTFSVDEMIVITGTFSVSGTFRIPSTALTGTTRMRVRSFPYNTPESIIKSGCDIPSLAGGETQDYLVFLSNNLQEDIPQIYISTNFSGAVCKDNRPNSTYSYYCNVNTRGNFGTNNKFSLDIVNELGQTISRLAESSSTTFNFKIPTDIDFGSSYYRLKATASNTGTVGFSNTFVVNDVPTLTFLDKEIFVNAGETAQIPVLLTGGSDWSWYLRNIKTGNYEYSGVGYYTYTNQPEYYLHTTNAITENTTYDIYGVWNNGCNNINNTKPSTVDVKIRENPKAIITDFRLSNPSCIYSQYSYSFTKKGTFGADNYFVLELLDKDNNFVSQLSIMRNLSNFFYLPSNLEDGIYRVRLSSTNPAITVYSQRFTVTNPITYTLSGSADILPGETTFIKLIPSRANYNASVRLSDNTNVLIKQGAREILIPVSPQSTTTYKIVANNTPFTGCTVSLAGQATVNVLSPRASTLVAGKVSDACAESTISLPASFNGSVASSSQIAAKLIEVDGLYEREMETSFLRNSLTAKLPPDAKVNSKYKLRITSTSPYVETETNEFSLKSKVTATISTDTPTQDIYENSLVKLKIDLTGESPWNVQLSDSSLYKNITQTPLFVNKNVSLRDFEYAVNNITSQCGIGFTAGKVSLSVVPLPVLSTSLLSDDFVCLGKTISIPYVITKGKFRNTNAFRLELFDAKTDQRFSFPIDNAQNPFQFNVPKTLKSGSYAIRVSGSDPAIDGAWSPRQLTIKPLPTATTVGNIEVFQGDADTVSVYATGEPPFTLTFSDGKKYTALTNKIVIPLSPKETGIFALTNVSNVCGEGTASGIINVKILSEKDIDQLVSLYPNPTPNDVYIDMSKALFNYFAGIEVLDINGRSIGSSITSPVNKIFDMSRLASGTYYLKIITDKRTFLKKVVKL